jgi:hypothetical protein
VQHASWACVRSGDCLITERKVPIAALTATQAVGDGERVAREASDWTGEGDFRPLALDYDGKLFLLSEHHHAEAAKRAGETELNVRVMVGGH